MLTGLPNPVLGMQQPLPAGAPSPFSDVGFPPVVIAINPAILFPQNPVGLPLAFAPPNFRVPVSMNATYFSSGFLAPPALLGPQARQSYAFQFASTFNGTILYQCDLHNMMGMNGKVDVLPPPAVPRPSVYHVDLYTTQFGGYGCASTQFLSTYTIPPNVCFQTLEAYPFRQTVRLLPATGPIATNGTMACNPSNCVHFLRWDLPSTLAPCFSAAPPDISFVAPLDKSCVWINAALQVRVSAASRHVWSLGAAVAALLLLVAAQ